MATTYGSVCSGIEAATIAWHPLGMKASWFSEIEPFPCAVLAHHFPDVPNLGDMTKLAALVLTSKIPAPDVLVGGTPCQAFSVAGMRDGLTDPRGALTIKYVELADAVDYVRAINGKPASIIVWENVPGVLSDKGNAFGCFLGALAGEDCELQPSGKKWPDAGCVYGPKRTIAWRVLDAQYFGLAQRRRRVFVVASARDGFDPVEVLFEREGVRRDTAPRRGQGQDLAGRAPFGPSLQCGCGWVFGLDLGQYGCPNCEGDEGPAIEVLAGVPAFGGHSLKGDVSQAATLTAKDTRLDIESETFCVTGTLGSRATGGGGLGTDFELAGGLQLAGTLQANGKAAGSATQQDAESGMLVVHGTQDPNVRLDQAHTLGRNNGQENAVLAFTQNSRSEARFIGGDGQIVGALSAEAGAQQQNYLHCREIAQTVTSNYGKQLDNTNSGLGPNVVTHAIQAGALRCNPDSGPDGVGVQADHAYTLEARSEVQAIQTRSAVRRLTPRECERLQGFPDDYTLIPYRSRPANDCPDGPRYKAIGNSKAVPVVRWIGRRIQQQLERIY
ncbi:MULTISPECIES: DNA cytosine methyltransferase [unclassified Pseudomonas]|uniref:DNA cytosine methyltransferase n=1 Tax=unclassified Pseudomonas TaxID=196821 RepID=UPI000A1DA088|nr:MULTISPECIES: DNA (cytosine-5-)-methyltransferase [unclassified Pseudomonas]